MRLSQLSMPSFAIPQSRIAGNLGEDLQDFAAGVEELQQGPAGNDLRGDSGHLSRVGESLNLSTEFLPQHELHNESVSKSSRHSSISS